MKKVLMIVLSFVMVFTLFGCGEDSETSKKIDELKEATEKLEEALKNSEKPEETDAPETDAPETDAPETDAPETEAPETDAPETEAPETDAPETETPTETSGMTVQEYVDSAKDLVSKQSSSVFNVSIEAEGNNLVYNYNYLVETADNAKEAMDAQIENSKDIFTASANSIRKECAAVEKVIFRYFDINGELIGSYEF
ncbi:MAG: DUF4854 domain-containing protein [Clostridia bacterium]|nr:DUF4854 domain-containing protein [Clostridia bacterium]